MLDQPSSCNRASGSEIGLMFEEQFCPIVVRLLFTDSDDQWECPNVLPSFEIAQYHALGID